MIMMTITLMIIFALSLFVMPHPSCCYSWFLDCFVPVTVTLTYSNIILTHVMIPFLHFTILTSDPPPFQGEDGVGGWQERLHALRGRSQGQQIPILQEEEILRLHQACLGKFVKLSVVSIDPVSMSLFTLTTKVLQPALTPPPPQRKTKNAKLLLNFFTLYTSRFRISTNYAKMFV